MSIDVVTDTETHLTAAAYVARGAVFRTFESPEVDSGNISYGIRVGPRSYFVKTAGSVDTVCALGHPDRITLLRNAVRLHQACRAPGLASLLNVIEATDGPLLVYEWVAGESLGGSAAHRVSATSAHARFRALPAGEIIVALDGIVKLHEALARAGWVAVDFYDGALLYDFVTGRMTVIDVDHYHAGPLVNTRGRQFGSTRFMAPEEFERGAQIDERTTVFTLGRLLAMHEVMVRACQTDPASRYTTVGAFGAAWRAIPAKFVRLHANKSVHPRATGFEGSH